MTINCRRIFDKKAEFAAVMDYVKPKQANHQTLLLSRQEKYFHQTMHHTAMTGVHLVGEFLFLPTRTLSPVKYLRLLDQMKAK